MKKVVMALVVVILIAAAFSSCTKEDNAEGDGKINGHTYVDLGLPSGTLWAACNLGANSPEDYGSYFAWGETQPKSVYAWDSYAYVSYDDNGNLHITKYNPSNHYYGPVDNLTTLLPGDDAARVNWGSDWQIPTKAKWEELISNTTVTWTTQNGVDGRLFTATNGAELFLPTAGRRYNSSVYCNDTISFYWSSSLRTDFPSYAWGIWSGSGFCEVSNFARSVGQSVRAVHPALQN